MHGYSGDEEDWPNKGRIAQVLDNLIAKGKAKPMIIVMPNNKLDQDAAPGHDRYGWRMSPMRNFPRNGDGTYEQYFPKIVNYIDEVYRTIPQKSGRAIAGFSMGAFHADHISKAYPDMFAQGDALRRFRETRLKGPLGAQASVPRQPGRPKTSKTG